MTAVESHSTTHVSRTRIAQLGDELMSTLTFVTPDTRFPPTGAKYKPALVDINYRATVCTPSTSTCATTWTSTWMYPLPRYGGDY